MGFGPWFWTSRVGILGPTPACSRVQGPVGRFGISSLPTPSENRVPGQESGPLLGLSKLQRTSVEERGLRFNNHDLDKTACSTDCETRSKLDRAVVNVDSSGNKNKGGSYLELSPRTKFPVRELVVEGSLGAMNHVQCGQVSSK